MAPLIALLATYALARVALRRHPDRTLPGRIALAVMLVVTGIAHFTATEALAVMVPPPLPATPTVYATGVAELLFAALLVARPSRALGVVLALFFVALLPANIYSALHQLGLGGHGSAYLWFRVPLQVLFITWALACTRSPTARSR